MSDGGIVTTEVNGFTVTSNSGVSEAQLRQNLKPGVDEGVSKAGSELGKLGGKASAEKRAEAKAAGEEEPQERKIKPIPPAKDKPEDGLEAKDEEDKAEEPDKEEPEPDKKPNPRHDPKARMLEATRKEAEAKRALAAEREAKAALEARLAALERQRAPEASTEPSKRDPDAKPTPDGYESYEEYLDARDSWNRKQWEADAQKRSQSETYDRALSEQKKKFSAAVVPHLEKYSGDVLSLQTEFQLPQGQAPNGSNWIANELFASPESAPALMLHFTEHPEDLQRIAALRNPRDVSREMAFIEARLKAVTTDVSSEREDVSRAAPPVKPVTGKPYVLEGDSYREGMSLDDYAKVWNKRKRL